jgi:hypothetical protein
MSISLTDAVKRARAPKHNYRKTFPIPLCLSEALHREADNTGVTVTTLILEVLERGLPPQTLGESAAA